MQLGFVIDHARCIGCHACTVACKSENEVPLGKFRTWVKYTERGSFPDVKRSFAVLRCNQCSDAPCVAICPVGALGKRADGIVDIDPGRCIGCKSCMQACPYDALYIDDETGVAEKCHFCAHRTELDLAPACAVVCPTEAIIPGDFDDRSSQVSRLKSRGDLKARKTEAGTGPNVFYREVDPAGIAPLETSAAGGLLWADPLPGFPLDEQTLEHVERRAGARTTYDVPHPPLWGGRISAYLFTKSLAAGTALAAIPLWDPFELGVGLGRSVMLGIFELSLLLLLATGVLLAIDLRRPERFWYILRYPNWSSWLVKGTWILFAFGAVVCLWIALLALDVSPGPPIDLVLVVVTVIGASLTAIYTAWLFAQAKGRVLWLQRGLALGLLAHAVAGGAALLLLAGVPLGFPAAALELLRVPLMAGLAVHLLLGFAESRAAGPPRREAEYRRASRLVTHGPFARRHWWLGVVLGGVIPLLLLILPGAPVAWMVAAAAGLVGLAVAQDTLVRAGQALAIS